MFFSVGGLASLSRAAHPWTAAIALGALVLGVLGLLATLRGK